MPEKALGETRLALPGALAETRLIDAQREDAALGERRAVRTRRQGSPSGEELALAAIVVVTVGVAVQHGGKRSLSRRAHEQARQGGRVVVRRPTRRWDRDRFRPETTLATPVTDAASP